jgi:iron complex outermembrane receptor protein
MTHVTWWRGTLATIFLLGSLTASATAQQASLSGTVTDSVSGTPVDGVRVDLLVNGDLVARTYTDRMGAFQLEALAPGLYTAVFTRIGHRGRIDQVELAAGQSRTLSVVLAPLAFTVNPVIVTASRTEQKALDAPASVSVIETETIEETNALTSVDHVAGVAGVDFARTGLTQHEIVVRGFNNVASGALLALSDYRYISVPSLRINVFNFIPVTNDDLERIEVVRGPGSALYGPNSANGVMHMITQSPFEHRGGVVALAGGSAPLLQGALRYGNTLGQRVGLKLSAQYLRGEDWQYVDPMEQANRAQAIAGGADPDTLLIGARDSLVERLAGELRVDWRPGQRTELVTAVGLNNAMRNVDLTPLGAAQLRDWRYLYAQSRLRHGRLFAQAFVNLSDAGDTYLLRNGNTVQDNSYMVVAQAQHNSAVGSRTGLIYGVDFQSTVPRTEGTITGRNEQDDMINELGGYLHADVTLSPILQLIAAARVDLHNRLPAPVFSPRAALVYQAAPAHTLRLTYNRAFSTPTTNNLFLDLFADSLRAPNSITLPYAVRVEGVPETGYSFARTCNGLCMRSPFTPASVGSPTDYIPIDATLLWDPLVDTLQNFGIDISAIPAPTSNEVATVLGRLNISGPTPTFDPVTDVSDIPALSPTITNTVELGYSGLLGDWLSVGIDVYHTWKNDFISAEQVETPNAFFDQPSLAGYLASFMPPDSAQLLASLIGLVPVGTVTPQEAFDPWDIIVTYRNFGKITLWGADVDLAAFLSRSWAVRGTYSWVSRNEFTVVGAVGRPDTIPLNASANKGALALQYRHEGVGLSGEIRGRAVQGFPVLSGVYQGEVDSYGVADLAFAYRLPTRTDIMVTLDALNILDNVHREFVGAPEIGRLVTLRVRAAF